MENNYCFSKIYSEIKSTWPVKSSNEETDSSRDSEELFEQRFVKVFWSKSKAHGRSEIKEQAPQLTLLCHGRTVRNSHRRCCIRKLFLKICNIHRKHLHWSLFLKNLQTFRHATLLKRDPNTGVFLWILRNF